ncbi:3340_t:CDS:2 [Rhizophagus irregularis]|nr:3340_t:CDS:2 [Rhizophagus irregularis]
MELKGNQSSTAMCCDAIVRGVKIPMGEVLNFPIITVQGIEVPINMVVTESETYSVIIGNNLLRKVKANIDYETSIMIISWKGKEARISPEIIIELSSNKRQSTPTKEQQEFFLTSQLYDSDTIRNIEYEELTQEIKYNHADIKDLSKITLMELSIGKLLDNQRLQYHKQTVKKGNQWTAEQNKAFNTLKKCLVTSPIFIFSNFDKQFILFTDASISGLGAILLQLDKRNQEHVIAYTSWTLSKAEKNYTTTELKCLAVIWAIKHFYTYVYKQRFKLITDHSALKHLFNITIPVRSNVDS